MSLASVYEAVPTGDAESAAAETEAVLGAETSAADILPKACIPAMTEVSRLFETGVKFVSEMLIAARAMQAALELLRPELVEAEVEAVGKVVIGTVAGDLHDIGKNLVAMMLEGAGFEIIDLSTDAKPGQYVAAVQEHEPDLVGMSALLTTIMTSISRTIDALTEAGLRDEVKIMIGGAPITEAFADQVAPTDMSRVQVVRRGWPRSCWGRVKAHSSAYKRARGLTPRALLRSRPVSYATAGKSSQCSALT